MRVLVTGATGYVGSRLVAHLLQAGHQVFAATRDPSRLAGFGWHDDVTGIALDAGDPTSVRAAFAASGPLDVVYYLVHGIGEAGFRQRDNSAAASVAQAAKEAGVARIVYLGGFVPELLHAGDILSDHLAGRAEVAGELDIDGGPELVWLGAAVIIGAGSTSFELVRYVGDRLLLIPLPSWVDHRMDPISISDVLHYLLAAGDKERVAAGGYDIVGPGTTTYRGLLGAYIAAAGTVRAGVSIADWQQNLVSKGLISRVAGKVVPVPTGLAADLIESLEYPMTASVTLLRDVVPDPPGGLTSIADAVAASLSSPPPRPVDRLRDPHHLADSDPQWAGGDLLRIRKLAAAITPRIFWPTLELLSAIPGPVAGAVRTGLDLLIGSKAEAQPT
jgi:uncharacterized protein YbjT (DUF2867 family)